MILKKVIFFTIIIMSIIMITGCPPKATVKEEQPIASEQTSNTKTKESIVTEPDKITKLRNLQNVAKKFVEAEEFQKSIAVLKTIGKQNTRVYVARVDELSLGSNYKSLGESDVAFENGVIAGFLSQNIKIAEKLNAAKIREKREFITDSIMQAFYMHPINLKSIDLIKKDLLANYLLTYSIVHISNTADDVVAYFRFIDLQTMQIFGSFALRNGINKLPQQVEDYFNEYSKCFIVAKQFEIPASLNQTASRLGVLDVDIINVKGQYSVAPSLKLMGIEDGIISGLLANDKYPSKQWIVEKTSGFNFKFPPVYNNIVFNTNPLLFEEWQEAIDNSSCTELLLYRYVQDEGLFLRLVDMKKQGEILNTSFTAFSDAKFQQCSNIFKTVSASPTLNTSEQFIQNLQNKRVLIVDGDYQSIYPANYFIDRLKYKEHQFAVEEGLTKGLLCLTDVTKLQLKYKLKTIYLKRDWMYENKIFNSNPLYLDSWKQLQSLGIDVLLIYNNLIRYHDVNNKEDKLLRNIAISFKAIDVTTGDIFYTNEITQ